ncbi:MAG TPA: glycosyltransferase [Terracidiphilus sp.]|jgi:glycosyltransferase involved in cell wall biosynthesis
MTRPIRVLFFDHTAELGGGEIALADLVRHLDHARIDPVVVLGSQGPLEQRIQGFAPVYVVPIDAAVVGARKDALGLATPFQIAAVRAAIRYVFRLRRLLKDQHVEVLHTNSLKAFVLGGIAGRLQRVKVIWHVRDRIADDYLPIKVVWVMRRLAKILPHFVIANSRATLDTVGLNGTRPAAVIGSGVDLSKFSPRKTPADIVDEPRSASAKTVGLVGRICPWKGQHIFIEAAALVQVHFPNVRFQIIGAALFQEHDYDLELRRTVEQRGLGQVIEFTGFQSDIVRAISGLDVLVHASTVGEPFGQVIVQGMACEVPVIATNGGGVPEIVQDGETGLLVPMGDANAMAEAICRLLEDEDGARRMGVLGRKRVVQHFTIDRSAEKLMEVCERVAGRAPSTGNEIRPLNTASE